jgi:negative regulator of sigma-B (phosphoserine phosphatase)
VTVRPPNVAVARRIRARKGEAECGDAVVCVSRVDETTLAVIDALGHGPQAAVAARTAVDVLERADGSVEERFGCVHDALRGTRGAAMTVVVVSEGRVVAAGIGNVALRVSGIKLPFFNTPGVLGAVSQRPRITSAPLVHGSRIVLHTDGVSSRFSLHGVADLDVEAACGAIFEERASWFDDAALLVADVR